MQKKAAGNRGTVAQQTYEAVEKLVAEKKLTKAEAFQQVAKATKRSPGTVAVTYYRFSQKQRGGPEVKRGPGRPSWTAGEGRIFSLLNQLSRALRAQQQEIKKLRRDAEFGQRLRKIIG